MKVHTTNYQATFIEVAEDCPVSRGEIPPVKGDKKTVANLQFDMLMDNPYRYSSDEVLFSVFATRKEIPEHKIDAQRQEFFSKGQPCFRASPLAKSYGWGVHHNEEGKIAIFGKETEAYRQLVGDASVVKLKAMRSKKA